MQSLGVSQSLPNGRPRFAAVRDRLPDPERVAVEPSVELEALHLPGPDPAIVFVHGGLGSPWNPYQQLAAFRGERELLTYSLEGNGASTARPEGEQSLLAHVEDLAALLDELDVERPIVHGWSYGTAIALEFAKRHPAAGLVLHAGGSHDLTPSWEGPLLRAAIALRLYRIPSNRWLVRQLAGRAAVHEATPEAVVEDFLETNPMPHRRSAWTTVRDAFWGYDGRTDLERVDAPTLVAHGPADRIVPIRVARETADLLPHAAFVRLDRTGHVAPAERPDAYDRLLRALVAAATGEATLDAAVREARVDLG